MICTTTFTKNPYVMFLNYLLVYKYIDGNEAWKIFSDADSYKLNNKAKKTRKKINIKSIATIRQKNYCQSKIQAEIYKNNKAKAAQNLEKIIRLIAENRKCKEKCTVKSCQACAATKNDYENLLYDLANDLDLHKNRSWLNFNTSDLKEIKREIFEKLIVNQKGLCCYCKRSLMREKFATHIDHIKPKAKYPSKTLRLHNLALACIDCNFAKKDNVTKFNPNIDNYNDAMLYKIEIGNYKNVIHYTPRSTIGKDLYQQVKLYRIETKHLLMRLNMNLYSRLIIKNDHDLNIYSDELLNHYCDEIYNEKHTLI